MVAIYCFHCAGCFPSISALHSHLKKLVPNGSYTFDFKSKTGYPNENSFPVINLSEIGKGKQFKDKHKQVAKKKTSGRLSNKDRKGTRPIDEKRSGTPLIIKQECKLDWEIHDDEVSDSKAVALTPKRKNYRKIKSNKSKDEKQSETTLTTKDRKMRHYKVSNLNPVASVDEIKQDNDTADAEPCGELILNDDIDYNNDDDDYNDDQTEDDDKGNNEVVDGVDKSDYNIEDVDNGNNGVGESTEIFDDYLEKDARKNRNKIEFKAESEGSQRPLRKCRKRIKKMQLPKPTENLEYQDYGFETEYSGSKTYLMCSLCGEMKELERFIDHIESFHGDETLSQGMLQKLHELRRIIRRSTQSDNTEKNDDSDLGSIHSSEDEEYVVKKKHRPTPEVIYRLDAKKENDPRKRPRWKYYVNCRICKMLVSRTKLKFHEKSHNSKIGKKLYHPNNLTRCPKCERVILKRYTEQHRCLVLTPINADGTPKVMDDEKQIERKKKVIDTLLPCHICGDLVGRYKMKDHVICHSDNKQFECEICKKRFHTKQRLYGHKKHAHVDRNFLCNLCPKSFKSNYTLNAHLVTHSEERKFTCSECGKAFKTSRAVKDHIRIIHTGFKRFECEKCGKRFKKNDGLGSHIKNTHDQIKDWICSWPDCAKLFFTGTTLRRHMIIHSGEKPIKCTHCDAGFTQRPELKFHLKRKHNTDEMPPPNNTSLYTHLPQIIIRNPLSKEGEKAMDLKTLFFPTAKENPFKDLVIEIKDPPFYLPPSTPPRKSSLQKPESTEQLLDSVKTSENSDKTTLQQEQEQIEQNEHSLNQEETEPQNSLSEKLSVSPPVSIETSSVSSNITEDSQILQNEPTYSHSKMHFDTAPLTAETQNIACNTSTNTTMEGVFISNPILQVEQSYLEPSLKMEDVSKTATTTALEAISLDELIGSSHMTISDSNDESGSSTVRRKSEMAPSQVQNLLQS